MTAVDLTGAWYAVREDVADALESSGNRRSSKRIDRGLEDATRWIDLFLNRAPGAFLPITETRYFPWPQGDYSRSWVLYLGQNTLADAPTVVTSGGIEIDVADVLAEGINEGPPYNRLELNLGSAASFATASTHQRQIAVTGTWGWRLDARPAGALSGSLNGTSTTATVTDSSLVGIGHVLTQGAERMIVTGKAMADTGQTVITTALTDAKSNTSISVTSGSELHVGEILLIDSERMLVEDIAGNTVTVERAIHGTVLAAHATSSVIYAPRALTVVRAALGTDAAIHSDAATLTTHVIPGPIVQLAIAETLEDVLQGAAGYAREVKQPSGGASGEIGTGIDGIRHRVRCAYARKAGARKMAI